MTWRSAPWPPWSCGGWSCSPWAGCSQKARSRTWAPPRRASTRAWSRHVRRSGTLSRSSSRGPARRSASSACAWSWSRWSGGGPSSGGTRSYPSSRSASRRWSSSSPRSSSTASGPVEKLDDSPPTSSFPSGHTGAATGLYFTLALMALRIPHPVLRRVVVGVCLAIPFLVGTARLYRGMHHVSDVIVAMVNGVVAVGLAWCWLRRGAGTDAGTDTEVDAPWIRRARSGRARRSTRRRPPGRARCRAG